MFLPSVFIIGFIKYKPRSGEKERGDTGFDPALPAKEDHINYGPVSWLALSASFPARLWRASGIWQAPFSNKGTGAGLQLRGSFRF
jgi:hypothetical protein